MSDLTGFVLVDQTTGLGMTPELLADWAADCQDYLQNDVAPAHGFDCGVTVRVGDPDSAIATECVTYLVNRRDDVPGAEAFHTENSNGTFNAFDMLATVLDAGGTLDDVKTALDHELAETLGDACCNRAAQRGDGVFDSLELCDRVQDTSYHPAPDGCCPVRGKYPRSNFLYPAAFDPQAPAGSRFDHMGVLSAPFTETPGGYHSEWDPAAGQWTQVFGESVPGWKRDRLAKHGRRAAVAA